MKTKIEIINEIVEYYSQDTSRRAVVNGKCRYYIKEGNKVCAVGYCLTDPKNFPSKNSIDDCLFDIEDLWSYFKPEYRIEDIEFWQHLQDLHDRDGCWNVNGLSEEGERCVKRLKQLYA